MKVTIVKPRPLTESKLPNALRGFDVKLGPPVTFAGQAGPGEVVAAPAWPGRQPVRQGSLVTPQVVTPARHVTEQTQLQGQQIGRQNRGAVVREHFSGSRGGGPSVRTTIGAEAAQGNVSVQVAQGRHQPTQPVNVPPGAGAPGVRRQSRASVPGPGVVRQSGLSQSQHVRAPTFPPMQPWNPQKYAPPPEAVPAPGVAVGETPDGRPLVSETVVVKGGG